MVRDIMRDEAFLSQISAEADASDIETAGDLMDTLLHNSTGCVGMAANMIGVLKRIIVFDDGGRYEVMLNPVILKASEPYEAEEGCLSLVGTRKCKRYEKIKVQWQNEKMQTRVKNYSGFTAEIIQHEIDHLNGIII